jgi:hypothetical protein
VGLFFKAIIMATKKKEAKEVKAYKVLKSSIGTLINFKGKQIILNNGLDDKVLKQLFNAGYKCIVANV